MGRFLAGMMITFTIWAWPSLWGAETNERIFHEAFIAKANDINLLHPVNVDPPRSIVEKIPPQTGADTQWIPGYWAWIEEEQDYVWVTGLWRNPPPGHVWNKGRWLAIENGWAWLQGFWSKMPVTELAYHENPPPDALNEEAPAKQDPSSFWLPGYWAYNDEKGDYSWLNGYWEKWDPNWVLVPAHYIWRPNGYALVEPYWDWPLEFRGEPYAAIAVNGEESSGPYQPLNVVIILDHCYLNYPDYQYLCCHHFHFHPEYWSEYQVPTWWYWDQWWSIGYYNTWGLWWWYTHPGYPQPNWMTREYAGMIAPPSSQLLQKIQMVNTPAIVTPNGIVTKSDLIKASNSLNPSKVGKVVPIVPLDPSVRTQMEDKLKLKLPLPKMILKPEGSTKVGAIAEGGPKPNLGDASKSSSGLDQAKLPRPSVEIKGDLKPFLTLPKTGSLDVMKDRPIKPRTNQPMDNQRSGGNNTDRGNGTPDEKRSRDQQERIQNRETFDDRRPNRNVDTPYNRYNRNVRKVDVRNLDQLNRDIIKERTGYDFPDIGIDRYRREVPAVKEMYNIDREHKRQQQQQDQYRQREVERQRDEEERRRKEEEERRYNS